MTYHVRAALIRNVARREQHLSYLQLVTARARAPIGRDVTWPRPRWHVTAARIYASTGAKIRHLLFRSFATRFVPEGYTIDIAPPIAPPYNLELSLFAVFAYQRPDSIDLARSRENEGKERALPREITRDEDGFGPSRKIRSPSLIALLYCHFPREHPYLKMRELSRAERRGGWFARFAWGKRYLAARVLEIIVSTDRSSNDKLEGKRFPAGDFERVSVKYGAGGGARGEERQGTTKRAWVWRIPVSSYSWPCGESSSWESCRGPRSRAVSVAVSCRAATFTAAPSPVNRPRRDTR